MAGLVPAIHVLTTSEKKDVDGRNKSGHDEGMTQYFTFAKMRTPRPGISTWSLL
jgi:hypothetical protein